MYLCVERDRRCTEQAITKTTNGLTGLTTLSFQAVATLASSLATTLVQCRVSLLGKAIESSVDLHKL
jgi:hypothetical protein